MDKIAIIGTDKIMSEISEVAKSARNVESRIHVLAFSTLDHIRTSGDYRGAVALLNALPKGQRVQGLAAWYRHFSNGKITLRQDKSKVWVCALKDRTEADFDMDTAEVTTFAELTEEAGNGKPMDMAKLVQYLERTSTNDKTLKDGSPKVTSDTRALAAKIVAAYRAGQFTLAAGNA